VAYFLLLLSVGLPALWSRRKASSAILFFICFLLIFVFVGFRYQTGGDWWNYQRLLLSAYGTSLTGFIFEQHYEALYALLNWIGANLFGGLLLVNSVCAFIFSFSLFRFCWSQPKPWLALTLAVPYLVIVVAMGYTRQSVAIAFEMFALLCIQSGQPLRFILFILLGSLFHRPVLALMSLLLFSSETLFVNLPYRTAQLLKLLILSFAIYGFYSAYSTQISTFVSGYASDYSDYSPQGAVLRIGLTAVFSFIFLIYRKSFLLSLAEYRLWSGLTVFALIAVAALFIGFLPTAIDRLALYLLPIQLFVGSRLPGAHVFSLDETLWTVMLVSFSFLFLYVWLNFANNSSLWLPYVNVLFG